MANPRTLLLRMREFTCLRMCSRALGSAIGTEPEPPERRHDDASESDLPEDLDLALLHLYIYCLLGLRLTLSYMFC